MVIVMDHLAVFDTILLEPEQENLLTILVETMRSTPPEERRKILADRSSAGTSLLHPGLRGRDVKPYMGDIETLAHERLISITYGSRGSPNIDVTPLGFRYYEYRHARSGESIQRMDSEVKTHLAASDFKARHPASYEKWMSAEQKLWSADSTRELTVIGHLCREAMQHFVNELLQDGSTPEIDPDPAHVVARVRSILHTAPRMEGKSEQAFVEALISYWGALSDLVQRQEHGAQKEGLRLTWRDARRVVFHTAITMFEIDAACL